MLLPVLAWGVAHETGVAVAALLTIIAADIADGIVARHLLCETTTRRIVDAGIDKLLIHGACVSVVVADPRLVPLYLPLAVLDIALVVGNLAFLHARRVFVTGDGAHRLGSACIAVLGLLALCGAGRAVTVAGVVAWIVNYALAARYARALRRMPIRGTEIAVLRTGKSHAGPTGSR